MSGRAAMERTGGQHRAAGGEPGALGLYLRELGSCSPLAAEDEKACARQAAAGDAKARDRLVQANLRFVVSVARQYRGRGVPLEDLVSEGNLGLFQAARRFDPERGVRFVTYAAWWVRRAMLDTLRDGSGQAGPFTLSLDACPGDDGNGEPLSARLADEKSPGPETALDGVALQEQVGSALAGLPGREAGILRDRFGLDGRAIPLREAATKYGLSSERVRRIEKRALRRVRASAGAPLLAAYAS